MLVERVLGAGKSSFGGAGAGSVWGVGGVRGGLCNSHCNPENSWADAVVSVPLAAFLCVPNTVCAQVTVVAVLVLGLVLAGHVQHTNVLHWCCGCPWSALELDGGLSPFWGTCGDQGSTVH